MMTWAPMSMPVESTTVDMTGLLAHVRTPPPNYRSRHRNPDPHPALIALIAVGGLLICCAFWGLIFVWIALAIL